MNYKILYFLIFWPCFLQGQNLLINGGFDSISGCPSNQNQFYKAINWRNCSNLLPSSPDLYNVCGPIGWQVPSSAFGYQFPKNGNGYAGILAFVPNAASRREFIQGEFVDPLSPNKDYYVEFWCVMEDNINISVRNLGALISDSAININFLDLSTFLPQIENDLNLILSDTLNWMKISGVYSAHGGEKFISIGNFYPDSLTIVDTIFSNPSFYFLPYFFIDAVSVIPVDSLTSIKENGEFNFETYPNPTNDILNINLGTNGAANCKFSLYSLEGQLLYVKEEPISILNQIDMRRFSKGVYILEVKTDKGSSVKKIVKG